MNISSFKNFCIGFSLVVPLLIASGCGPSSADLWARNAIERKVQEQALIVDVRTPTEYNSGHIKGAINVPHTDVRQRIAEFGDDKAQPIVVYCGKGGRAQTAKMVLEEEGYTNVWNLGGLSNLAKANVAIE